MNRELIVDVLPYVSGLTEKAGRVMNNRISSAMKPPTTLCNLLVHPKDKSGPKTGVYTSKCQGCEKSYAGVTKRKLSTRVKKHR